MLSDLERNIAIIWILPFNDALPHLDLLKSTLSQAEVERSEKFKFTKDQHRFILTRGVLRTLLGKYLNTDPEAVEFEYSAYQKPSLHGNHSIQFNVGHSGSYAVLGFHRDTEIGVDVEFLNPELQPLSIAQNFFSSKEVERLGKFPKNEQIPAFYRCWTRKEAIIKALGTGLSFPLDAFAVSMEDDQEAELLETLWEADERVHWQMRSHRLDEEHLAAVAIRDRETEIRFKPWESTFL
ncbi:4'-phosphopantetheinyl transferase family protein [Poritiphilus flavus]|uniref:4'-phosphopantetheinyl transferase superfamily protein n=1 Tax=Poritiphilus flavus TaxID=2697053 RepID=A0A6L9EF80_9FLAO|nr:4'-phosphopantetheinyl transferase superfamily protein [Poritiphilus flavus]NAS13232.1 4'-phosphopantetheinyl transferase superfamily protein [Poritiphilus flavus]